VQLELRRTSLTELESSIQDIWSLVVNEDSLPGEAAAEMQTCAMKGKVIVVNVTKIRSNAIIVSQTQGFAIASPMGIRKSPRSDSVQLN